jgi:hypothetical protein
MTRASVCGERGEGALRDMASRMMAAGHQFK